MGSVAQRCLSRVRRAALALWLSVPREGKKGQGNTQDWLRATSGGRRSELSGGRAQMRLFRIGAGGRLREKRSQMPVKRTSRKAVSRFIDRGAVADRDNDDNQHRVFQPTE